MDLTEQFGKLDKMIQERSTDVVQMRELLDLIRPMYDGWRVMEVAQDKLYASIARGHRKTLLHLEAGDTADAMREAAGAVAWFYLRFQGGDLDAMNKYPHIAEELRAVRELAARSVVLKEALSQSYDIHAP